MEALKKAELAKRKAEETPSAPTLDPAPAPKEPTKLELAPTDAPAAPKATDNANAGSNAAPGENVEPPPVAKTPPSAPTAAQFNALFDRDASNTRGSSAPSPGPALAIEPKTRNDAEQRAPNALRAPRREKIPKAWIVLGAVLLLCVSAGGYWYYASMSDYLRQQAAITIPQPVSAAVPVAQDVPAPEEPAVAKSAPAKATKTVRPVQTAPVVATPSTPIASAPVETLPSSDASPAVSPAEATTASDASPSEIYRLLQSAYAAYRSGDDVRAQVAYANVLTRDEHNRDALLGLAAIAVRNRDTGRARDIYDELLTLNPKDTVAQAGLAGLTASLDPVAEEARLKTLLDQEPNAPHLLFAYASLLMQQQRWSESSRALQTAIQFRDDQPDYAYNLAVSLDHLGQTTDALRHYRRAIELARKQPASFSSDAAARRITVLEAAPDGVPQ